jgi:hypothetical protein
VEIAATMYMLLRLPKNLMRFFIDSDAGEKMDLLASGPVTRALLVVRSQGNGPHTSARPATH